MPHISLVVPAYNEERYLPALLSSIEVAKIRYAKRNDAIEIVIADNASSDATASIARDAGCHVVVESQRSIAAARNAGARAATGTIIAFVDADSRIHPDTFAAIDRTLKDDVIVGVTGVRVSRMSPGIFATTLVIDTISHLNRVGTGVVFCRRADWEAVGGYDRNRRYAEDFHFLVALKRLGRTRGQQLAFARNVPAVTSARKFDRHGDWHIFTTLAKSLGWLVADRPAFDRFVQRYWYEDR
ncbi:MAG TPA: glycosyltransferase [Casimicrobiaceae bacterium]|nr:glycosyltransferase [Casimicrobiaceae bacterium]